MTDAEIDRLAGLLEEIGAPMSLEGIDGCFTALVCAPELVPLSEALPAVVGEAFDGGAVTEELLTLLVGHWSSIATGLEQSLDGTAEHLHTPLLFEDDAGVARGNDWAAGFLRGVQMRPADWRDVLGRDYGGALFPILVLANEHHPDPAQRPQPIGREQRDELMAMLVPALTTIYRDFAPQRQARAQAAYTTIPAVPARRAGPKVGRNEPCPCGSARKYKHCCLGRATTFA